jgi:hypothetical protein
MGQPNICPIGSSWYKDETGVGGWVEHTTPNMTVGGGYGDITISSTSSVRFGTYCFYNQVVKGVATFFNGTLRVFALDGSGAINSPYHTEFESVAIKKSITVNVSIDNLGNASITATAVAGSVTEVISSSGLLNPVSDRIYFKKIYDSPNLEYLSLVGQGLPNQCQQLYRYLGNYEVTLDLAMKMRDNWNGNNTIFDWGSTADTYTFDGDLVTNDYSIWERLAGNATSPVLNTTGFNPFGTQFSGDVTGKRYPRYNGKANTHGEYQEWSGEMVMDSSGGYSYDTTAWVPTYATGFGIAGLAEFPVPEFTPVGVYSVAYNRIGKVIREYDSGEQSEQRKFEMKWENLSGEALRCILVKLTTVIRSNTFKIDFGTSLQRLSPWLPRAGEVLSGEYDIRLSNSVIKYTYTGGSCEGSGSWSLELECIKWEA